LGEEKDEKVERRKRGMCDVKKECVWLFGAKEERKSKVMVSRLLDLYGELCSNGVRVKAAKL